MVSPGNGFDRCLTSGGGGAEEDAVVVTVSPGSANGEWAAGWYSGEPEGGWGCALRSLSIGTKMLMGA